jgi:phenylalanyl-tRNA synthetase beta chain
MKISTNGLTFINQRYKSAGNPAQHGVTDLIERIGAQLGAVEETIAYGERFVGVVIVKVVSCIDHPNADHLHICKVDDGGAVENVDRDEDGLVQVVCGAPNVREGLTVAWLPPGATVPETYDNDPFVLEARALRGEMSNGMLASARELSLGDSHDGILELDDDLAAGMPFADAYNLQGDVVIDMENKMFTHRPDCFGWLGVAREIEGIYHRPYRSPDWYVVRPVFPAIEAAELPLEIHNDLPDLVPRFVAVTMRDVQVGPSPVWLQIALARMGLRPINNIVDYTNFFMLETGQPLHAYDYDKVKALSGGEHAAIVVRHPAEGEKITLLNGKEITPRAEAIMIATARRLIGMGGVMGGADTEVDEHTTSIIIECATFDMYSIRRTAMAHGLFTDAVTRFNKGQSPLQNIAVTAKIVDEIRAHTGGKIASPLIDVNNLSEETMRRGSVHAPVMVTAAFINERLGWSLSADEMSTLLGNVEFAVAIENDVLTVTAPFWRTDIELPEDVVEEVGRLYGYDHLPMALPRRDLTPAPKNPQLELKAAIRNILAGAGANEVLTYTFVHGNLLDKTMQSRDQAFQVANALSPDLQYYRMSLAPSLLDRIHPNLKAGYDHFVLFEMNKTHNLLHADDDDGLPTEFSTLACIVTAGDKTAGTAGTAFYEARTYLDYVASRLGIELEYAPITAVSDYPAMQPYDHTRSAFVAIKGGEQLGIVGEYKATVRKNLKLPVYTAGFEISLDALVTAQASLARYTALPRFPKVTQDITMRVPAAVAYNELNAFVAGFVQGYKDGAYFTSVQGTDIYQGEDTTYKNFSFRITAASYERTLTDDEVNAMLEAAAVAAHEQFGAERL